MARWPNFFIVGAPRSGTTSLYVYLKGHPDVFMPPEWKEPGYFISWDYQLPERVTNERDYLGLFARADGKRAIGEATPLYLYDPRAPSRIKAAVPHAKIIMLLRDPIDRAYSHYLLGVRTGAEQRSFYTAVTDELGPALKSIEATWPFYVQIGLYYEQVKRYLDTFGSAQVRIYLFDDLEKDPLELMKDICNFLDVPFNNGHFFDPQSKFLDYRMPRLSSLRRLLTTILHLHILGSGTVLSYVYKILSPEIVIQLDGRFFSADGAKSPMDHEAKEFLHSVYAADVHKLQGLIGRDLGTWLT